MLIKNTVIIIFSLLIIGGAYCADGNSLNPGIQDIIQQWAAIDRSLSEGQFFTGGQGNKEVLLDEIEAFSRSIQSYLNSEMYRLYRLAPFSSETNLAFGPPSPNEMPELIRASDLAFSFYDAVLNGERERAILISGEISGNLIQAMMRDGKAVLFASGAYFRLLVVLFIFIILTAIVIYFLYNALIRSLRRETEGSGFARAILLAHEDERSRLSRELHDTIAQDLRYLSLEMNKIGDTEEKSIREKLCAEAASHQSALIRKVRDICDYLVPPDFRFQGLGDALRRLCLDFGKRTGIDCRIDISPDNLWSGTGNIKQNFFDEEKQLQIFRIVQEALTNVEKHARATEAIVMLRCDPDGNLSVGISDDGVGFIHTPRQDVSNSETRFGIRGMKERAALLGGIFEIKSECGEGTLVRLQVSGSKNESIID